MVQAGAQTEEAAMSDVCSKFPPDEWCLYATHFLGLEPGPVVDVMMVFIKADSYPPARHEYYLDQLAETLAGLQAALTCDEESCEKDDEEIDLPKEPETLAD